MSHTNPTRREFTAEAVLALLAGVAVTVTGCSGGSSSMPSAPTPQAGDAVGAISANHGHTAIVRAAQLAAGNAVTITLSTGSGHTHGLSLSAAQITQIAAGTTVAQPSTTVDAHSHVVVFN